MRDILRSSVMFSVLTLLTLLPSPLAAQEARGTLQGRVVDTSGGAVPGATVEVLNLATGVVTPTTTNDQGSYRVPFLNPGSREASFSAKGRRWGGKARAAG